MGLTLYIIVVIVVIQDIECMGMVEIGMGAHAENGFPLLVIILCVGYIIQWQI